MASAERRQRWRKRRGAGQPMEVAAQKMKDSVKSSNHLERLARKYMQKCTVESSTESESESSAEAVRSLFAGGLKKARNFRGLQFLDPYDGDSEDASISSDCSLNSLTSIKIAPWVNSAPKAMGLEDADTSEDEESFPKPPDWLYPEVKVSEVQTVNDYKAPLELPSQEEDLGRSLLQMSELPRATEAFASTGQTPDHSLLMSVSPPASAEVLGSPGDTWLATLAPDCDGTMAEQPLIKRKQGILVPESSSEKLRKKFRAT